LVKVNAAGQNLVFQETHKTNTGAAFERSEDANNAFVALRFSKGAYSDESMIVFADDADVNYDALDVADLQSPVAESVEMTLQAADGAPLAQDARPYTDAVEIPVVLDMPEAGVYTFSVVEVQNLPLGACLTMEDLVTGAITTLTQGMSVTVEVSEAFQGVRYIIRSTPSAVTTVTGSSCNGLADASIDVSVPSSDWSVSLSAENGYDFMANGSVTFDHLEAGSYLLQVDHPSCGVSSAVIEVEQPAAIHTQLTGTEPVECNQGTSGMFTFEVENAQWFTYEVRNEQNELVRTANIEGTNALVEGLTAGLYTVHVFTPCAYEVLEVDLRDSQANTIAVEQQLVTLADNQFAAQLNAVHSQSGICTWSFSNGVEIIGNEAQLVLSNGETLMYSVVCQGDCNATANGSVQALSLQDDSAALDNAIKFSQTSANITLLFTNIETQQVDARLFDSQGRLVLTTPFVMVGGSKREFSTTELSKGAYTLVLSAGSKALFTQKFIK
jgi:hypothetical protein